MKTIRRAVSLLLGAAFIAGCNERNAPTGMTEKPGPAFSADATGTKTSVGIPDVALVFLSRPVNDIQPAQLAPEGYLDSFKNAELQAATFWDVGYGMLGAEDNFALTGDRRIARIGFKQLDATFLYMERDPGGPCVGDSGGPILLQASSVEYVVADLHGLHADVNNTKLACTGDFATQRTDLASVVNFIQSNITSRGP